MAAGMIDPTPSRQCPPGITPDLLSDLLLGIAMQAQLVLLLFRRPCPSDHLPEAPPLNVDHLQDLEAIETGETVATRGISEAFQDVPLPYQTRHQLDLRLLQLDQTSPVLKFLPLVPEAMVLLAAATVEEAAATHGSRQSVRAALIHLLLAPPQPYRVAIVHRCQLDPADRRPRPIRYLLRQTSSQSLSTLPRDPQPRSVS